MYFSTIEILVLLAITILAAINLTNHANNQVGIIRSLLIYISAPMLLITTILLTVLLLMPGGNTGFLLLGTICKRTIICSYIVTALSLLVSTLQQGNIKKFT